MTIARACCRTSEYVRTLNGPGPPGRWQEAHSRNRIGATSRVNVGGTAAALSSCRGELESQPAAKPSATPTRAAARRNDLVPRATIQWACLTDPPDESEWPVRIPARNFTAGSVSALRAGHAEVDSTRDRHRGGPVGHHDLQPVFAIGEAGQEAFPGRQRPGRRAARLNSRASVRALNSSGFVAANNDSVSPVFR